MKQKEYIKALILEYLMLIYIYNAIFPPKEGVGLIRDKDNS